MKNIFKNIIYLIVNIISFFIPKKNNYFVFYPTHEKNSFTGNLSELFTFGNENILSINFVWLTRSLSVHQEVINKGYKSVLLKTKFSHIPYFYIAQYIFIDGIIAPYNRGSYRFVQAWHGTGFKDIGVSNPNKDRESLKKLRGHFSRYHFVSATSKCDKLRKESCFNTRNVYVTGSPRNDVFFDFNEENKIKKGFFDSLNLIATKRVITYAPTYRDNNNTDFPINANTLKIISDMCEKSKSVFLIKNHPASKSTPSFTSNNVIDITHNSFNTQHVLICTDLLITDYSGIVTDFLLLNRPYIFYHNDKEQYEKLCRSFYYNLSEILPGPIAENETNLLESMFDTSWFLTESYQIAHKNFQKMFHDHIDGLSSKRFFDMLDLTNCE